MTASSLRIRLLLLVLVASAPAAALLLYAGVEQRHQATAMALDEVVQVAQIAAYDQTQLLEGARQLLGALAHLPPVQSRDSSACSDLFASVIRGSGVYTNLVAAKPDGESFCSAVPLPGIANYRDAAYFQRAVETREFTIGGYTLGQGGQPGLALAQPAIDLSGSIQAVVVLSVDLRRLNGLAANAGLPPGSVFFVVDANGMVLARYPDPGRWVGRLAPETLIVKAMLSRGKGVVEDSGLDGVRRFYGFVPLKARQGSAQQLYASVGIPVEVALAPADRVLTRALLGLGLVCVLALGGAWVAADRLVLRRVRPVVAATKRLGAGDLRARSGLAYKGGELDQLARAFDEMAAALEEQATRLREAEAKYRALVEQSLVGVYLATGDRFIYVNEAGAEIFGYGVDEVVERLRPADLVHPEDRALVAKNIQEWLSGTVHAIRYAFRGLRKDGRTIHCEVFGRQILHGGRPAVLGTLIDVTERTRAAEESRRLNRALRTLSGCNEKLVRATEESELLREVCHVVVDVGGYGMAWVGFAEQDEAKTVLPAAHAGREAAYLESVKVSWADTEGEADPAGTAIRTATTTIIQEISTDIPFAGWHAEAAARGYTSVIALPLVAEGRAFGVLVIWAAELGRFDEEEVALLTELADDLAYGIVALRTRAEGLRVAEELKRQREALYQREKLAALGSLLAGVAHELNNPLAVVTGRSALLRQAVSDGPLARHAEKIEEAANRCGRIVRNFLAMARQYPPERQLVSLTQIVEDALDLLAYQLRVGDVEVQLDLAPGLPTLWADGHQLHQMVLNLVTNAEQAMHDVTGPRRLRVTTRYEPERARVSLEVADTGPGIPPELHQKIFDPFFTTKPPGEGTGIGLALCQGIVDGHGGSIAVESRPGEGAVFRIELPVEAPPASMSEAEVAMPPIIRGKAILVVDDEPEVTSVLAEMLSTDGHRVETATDGATALAKLREGTFDLILSDIKMPGLDGPGLYREVERNDPALCSRFVFMTGDALSQKILKFLEGSGAPSLAKPFACAEVRRAVQRMLRSPAV